MNWWEESKGVAMGRVVVGVDGSEQSIAALRWALDYAASRDHVVEALTMWSMPMTTDGLSGRAYAPDPCALEADAAARLDDALRAACPNVEARGRIERIVCEDRPAHALVSASRGAELLVVGTRGHGGFAGLLLGSVSTQCVHHAHCPVAVIRPRTP
jgi:nucleotide-binding universal stress UspA family protein